MPTSMTALGSFVYLTDNVPEWINRVNDLSKHVADKYAEYVADYSRHLEHARPKKQKTPSLQSIHTERDGPLEPPRRFKEPTSDSASSTPNAINISPFEAGNKYLLAQAQRKRKLGSSIRSGASGPQKFRSKHMVIIYYDSYLQEELASLVKGLSGARNNLRKGKMAQSLSRGLQLPTLGAIGQSLHDNYNTPSSFGGRKLMTPISTRSLPTDPKISLSLSPPRGDAIFTDADTHLELAHTQCETAAHQVLRDGDCGLELKRVLAALDSVLEIARPAVEQLKAEKEKEQELENQTPADSDSTLVADIPSSYMYSLSNKLGPLINESIDAVSRDAATNGVTEIEVDDDSDAESIQVDISKFRSARMISPRANTGPRTNVVRA